MSSGEDTTGADTSDTERPAAVASDATATVPEMGAIPRDTDPSAAQTEDDSLDARATDAATPDKPARKPLPTVDVDLDSLPALPALPPTDSVQPRAGRSVPTAAASQGEAGAWQAAIDAYEREAKAIGNKPRAAALYLEIGRIWEEQLGKQRNAAMCYQRAFHLNKEDPSVLHAARRLFTEVDNPGMIIQILQAEIDATVEPEQRAMLMTEKATLLEERLGNIEEATKTYREAIEVWPAEPLALHSLEQLHLSRGEYDALYGVYQRAIAVAPNDGRRRELLIAAAQLAEDRLEDVAAAIGHYEQVLALDAASALALAALRRLLSMVGNWEGLVDVLVRSASATQSTKKATNYLVSAGKVYLERLDATDRALTCYLQALEHSPDDIVLLRDIEWLYEANGRFDDVAKVLHREVEVVTDKAEKVPVLFRLGAVFEERLDRPEDAVEVYREAVELLPDYVPARQALGRLYERVGRYKELAALFELEIEADTSDDTGDRVARLFKLADVFETRLERPDDAITRLRELLKLDPSYVPASRALERLLTAAGRHADLVALYESEFALAEDDEQKVFLLTRIGRLQEESLEDLDAAALAHRRIIGLSAHNLEAIRSLSRIAAKQQDWAVVLEACEKELDATSDQNDVVLLLYRIGTLQEEKLEDPAAATKTYEKVLTLAPSYLPALRSLGRLYDRQGRLEDLVSMYRSELDAAPSDEHAIGLLFRIAKLLADRIQDDGRAAKVYEEILERKRDSLAAVSALGQIYARRADHEKLERILSQQAESIEDPERKVELLRSVAELCEHELARPDRAAEIFQEILRLGVAADTAVEALVRIFSSAQLWSALGLALRSAAEVTEDPVAKAAILVRCAEVYGDKLDKGDQSIELLEEALTQVPNDTTILEQLARVYVARKAWAQAVEASVRLADLEEDDRMYAARQVRIAAMMESKLKPAVSGVEHFRKALERVPGHPMALRGIELAYRRAEEWKGLLELYRREALVSSDPVRRANLFFRAGDLAEHRLRDDEAADEGYRQALEVEPKLLAALEGRRRLADKRGDADVLLATVLTLSSSTADPERSLQFLFDAACLHQDRFQDLEKATAEFKEVLERAPRHTAASERLETLYRDGGDWSGVVEVLIDRADGTDDSDARAETYLAAAHVAQDKLRDIDRAVTLFTKVLELHPTNLTALTRLGPLLVESGAYPEAVDVFGRIVVSVKEPPTLAAAYRSLGLIYERHLVDLVKAVQSYQAAFQADPSDAESLRHLAAVYCGAQDWGSAVNVMLRLVDAETDAGAKVDTLLDLAKIYSTSLEDVTNAIRAYSKALEIAPSNMEANVGLIGLYEQTGDWKLLSEMAESYLAVLPPERRADAVPLHLKLADFYENQGEDASRATAELRSALSIEPDNSEALTSLARLYAKSEATFPQAVDIHRRLLRLDPFRVDSYHEMRRMFEKRSEFDKAFVVCELLVFLRAQVPEEDLFFTEFRDKVAPHPSATLEGDEHERWITHPGEQGVGRRLLEVLATELSRVFPGDLAQYDLNPRTDKIGLRSESAIRTLCDELGGVLGAPQFDVWVSKKFDTELFVENVEPLAVVMGGGFDRKKRETDKRFLLTRQIERLHGVQYLFDSLSPQEAEQLVYAAARFANSSFKAPRDADAVDAMYRRLDKSVSRRAKKALAELSGQVGGLQFDVAQHHGACVHTMNRAALALTNNIEIAIRTVARESGLRPVFADAKGAAETLGSSEEIRELLAYAVSAEYFAARAKLGFSIQS